MPCSRCTGYRPILDAFRVFAKADPLAYTEEAIEASQTAENGHATNGHANGATNGHSNGHANGAQGTSPSSSSDLSASTSTDPDDKGSEFPYILLLLDEVMTIALPLDLPSCASLIAANRPKTDRYR